jgi:hypothetical protein
MIHRITWIQHGHSTGESETPSHEPQVLIGYSVLVRGSLWKNVVGSVSLIGIPTYGVLVWILPSIGARRRSANSFEGIQYCRIVHHVFEDLGANFSLVTKLATRFQALAPR